MTVLVTVVGGHRFLAALPTDWLEGAGDLVLARGVVERDQAGHAIRWWCPSRIVSVSVPDAVPRIAEDGRPPDGRLDLGGWVGGSAPDY